MDQKPVKIEGELFWSQWMHQLNTKFNEDNKKYECTFCNLSDTAVEQLSALGVKVKNKNDAMGNYIVAKSKFIFEPVDRDGNPIDVTKIGNGTKAYALVTSYTHKMSNRYGAAPSFKKLIVTDMKTYNPDAKVAEEEDDVF